MNNGNNQRRAGGNLGFKSGAKRSQGQNAAIKAAVTAKKATQPTNLSSANDAPRDYLSPDLAVDGHTKVAGSVTYDNQAGGVWSKPA